MEEYIGIIKLFAGNFAPRQWAFCYGQLLPINQNQALFSILGTTYGGDGRTTFGLPDLRGAVPMGTGKGLRPDAINRQLGQKTGDRLTQLTVNNLPAHNHIITVSESAGTIDIPVNTEEGSEDEKNPGAGFLVNTGADAFSSESTAGQKYGGASIPVNVAATATASFTGNGVACNNVQPSLVLNYIICTDGLFPPRN